MRVPALHSTLRPDAIAAAIARDYDLGGTPSCAVWHRGFNDYFSVDAPSGRYVLRVYPTDKYWMPGESDVRFELDLLTHLHAAGLPVVPPAARRDGDVLGTLEAPEGRRHTALFRFAPGGPIPLEADDARTFGRVCARIHVVSSDFATTHRRYHLDADLLLGMPVREVTSFLHGSRDEDIRALRTLTERLWAQIETIPKEEPSYGVIHADLHDGNCHWDNGTPTVLDFDHCGYGWRAYDLVAAIDGVTDEVRDAFLEGYQSVRPITKSELDLLPVFAKARYVWNYGDIIAMADHLAVRGKLGDRFWDRYFTRIRSMLEDDDA